MNKANVYKIKPAGRHILTIGRDLIQDRYAAVLELVKNAYDADSPDVNIHFKVTNEKGEFRIIISDHGHGMSRDTVIKSWLVPSTDDKLKRRTSPAGRIMQGRKGVGRYATSILGNDLLMETVSNQGEKTTVFVEWNNFVNAEYLDDVEVLVETSFVQEPTGTILTITNRANILSEWDQRQINKLRFELKKLISPSVQEDKFIVNLTIEGFHQIDNIVETIEPYAILDLYDYMIAGKLGADGKGVFTYSTQKARNTVKETIAYDLNNRTGCGELLFDIRVYDREGEAIEALIRRGLKDEAGNYVGKLQARQILNEYNGIGVFRNGFRIRPLGDADFDWLKLNEQRVQNPSLRIGSNQVIGYVQIESEERSGLIEKSARDGLKDNLAFERLKEITKLIIAKLEEKRFVYRRKVGLNQSGQKLEKHFERLFKSDELEHEIRVELNNSGVSSKIADEVVGIINRESENKNSIVEEIRRSVAVYQGQATLGKIINVILHEGRRPLNYFKNQIPNLKFWFNTYLETDDSQSWSNFIPIAEGIGENAEIFVKLFGRLDPLASGKRTLKSSIKLKKIIEEIFKVFETELVENNISFSVTGVDEFIFTCWRQDMYAIFTNLIDNSIYWICEKNTSQREIHVEIFTKDDLLLYIDYRDTGPGIEPNHIANEIIFEPEFTTKPNGTGLGLAIAGEAAHRNGLELKAFESNYGAYFRIEKE